MTDAQFGALLTVLVGAGGAIVGMIKWSIGRITTAWDAQTAAYVRLADAQIDAAAKDAEMRTTIQLGLSTILEYLYSGNAPVRPSRTPVPGSLHSIDDDSSEFERPGAKRRSEARTPREIPRVRIQPHNDDNE